MTHGNVFARVSLVMSLMLASAVLSGCAVMLLGAAVGGGAYEGVQASNMEDLERDYEAGKISKEEYEARKKQIDKASLFQ